MMASRGRGFFACFPRVGKRRALMRSRIAQRNAAHMTGRQISTKPTGRTAAPILPRIDQSPHASRQLKVQISQYTPSAINPRTKRMKRFVELSRTLGVLSPLARESFRGSVPVAEFCMRPC